VKMKMPKHIVVCVMGAVREVFTAAPSALNSISFQEQELGPELTFLGGVVGSASTEFLRGFRWVWTASFTLKRKQGPEEVREVYGYSRAPDIRPIYWSNNRAWALKNEAEWRAFYGWSQILPVGKRRKDGRSALEDTTEKQVAAEPSGC
jgi:hypothetical protein